MTEDEQEQKMNTPMDYEAMMTKVFFPSFIVMVIIMVIGFAILAIFQNQLVLQKITQQQFTKKMVVIGVIMLLSMGLIIAEMFGMSIYNKFLTYRYQSEQNILDTFEVVIMNNPFDVGKYQIQTPPENSPQLKATLGMIKAIRNTESYKSLLASKREGGVIVKLDTSDLFATYDEPITDNEIKDMVRQMLKIPKETEIQFKARLQPDPSSIPQPNSREIYDVSEAEYGPDDQEAEDASPSVSREEIDFAFSDIDEPKEEPSKESEPEEVPSEESSESEDIEETEEASDYDSVLDGDTEEVPEVFDENLVVLNQPHPAIIQQPTMEEIQQYRLEKRKKEQLEDIKAYPIRSQNEINAEDERLTITINYDCLVKAELLLSSKESKWTLGYRNVKSVKALDDPSGDMGAWDDEKEKVLYRDPLLNIDAMCYLIPDDEKKVFYFHPRLASDEYRVNVRKCYCQFKLVGWLVDNRIPLFVYLSSPLHDEIYNIQLSSTTFGDAELVAHATFTHMAYNENANLHKTILGLRADLLALRTERDKMLNTKIENWLHDQVDPGNTIKEMQNRRKITPLYWVILGLFSVLSLLLGAKLGVGV